jgi:hypothetical protein
MPPERTRLLPILGRAGQRLDSRYPLVPPGGGGPVYTRPREGPVKALGIVMASRVFFGRGDLCYTPIQTVLGAFGAELPTGVIQTWVTGHGTKPVVPPS